MAQRREDALLAAKKQAEREVEKAREALKTARSELDTAEAVLRTYDEGR